MYKQIALASNLLDIKIIYDMYLWKQRPVVENVQELRSREDCGENTENILLLE